MKNYFDTISNTEKQCMVSLVFNLHAFPKYSLPTESEEKGVLGVGSIPVVISPSVHNMKTIAL